MQKSVFCLGGGVLIGLIYWVVTFSYERTKNPDKVNTNVLQDSKSKHEIIQETLGKSVNVDGLNSENEQAKLSKYAKRDVRDPVLFQGVADYLSQYPVLEALNRLKMLEENDVLFTEIGVRLLRHDNMNYASVDVQELIHELDTPRYSNLVLIAGEDVGEKLLLADSETAKLVDSIKSSKASETRFRLMNGILKSLIYSDAPRAVGMLNDELQTSNNNYDESVESLLRYRQDELLLEAIPDWLSAIENEEIRTSVAHSIFERQKGLQPEKFQTWVNSLSEDEKQYLPQSFH